MYGAHDAVGGDRAVQAVDAAAAVRRGVGQDLDHLVRRVRGDVAKRLVLERQHVALGIEGVVGGADRRAPVDAAATAARCPTRAAAGTAPRR